MRIEQRDAEFRTFYLNRVAHLQRVALLMTGDREAAADLAHEALLKSYRSWGRIRRDDPGPYVHSALVNLCRNHHRRRVLELRKKPAPTSEVAPDDRDVAEVLRVAAALSTLPPIRRAVIVLRYYEDMSEAEIARVLDRPVNTIKSDIKRSHERLRPLLAEGVNAS